MPALSLMSGSIQRTRGRAFNQLRDCTLYSTEPVICLVLLMQTMALQNICCQDFHPTCPLSLWQHQFSLLYLEPGVLFPPAVIFDSPAGFELCCSLPGSSGAPCTRPQCIGLSVWGDAPSGPGLLALEGLVLHSQRSGPVTPSFQLRLYKVVVHLVYSACATPAVN